MINELIEKYKQQMEKNYDDNNKYADLSKAFAYKEILKDLEELQEKIYQNLCGQYKYVYDKEEDFTEVAAGVFQCKVDEEVFYQNDRFNGKIYNLTFLGIVGVDIDE